MNTKTCLWLRILSIMLFLSLAGLFTVSANRGFDFTDEGYYLLNFQHWKEFTVLASYFGYYFSIPFSLFGESIFAIRLFGFALLAGCGYFYGLSFFRLLSERFVNQRIDPLFPSIILACCAFNYFGDLYTLITPSYNTLNLACMLVATGLLFRFVLSSDIAICRGIALGYGLTLSICFYNKFSSCAVLLAWHLAIMWVMRSEMRAAFRPSLLAFAGFGFVLNIALVWVAPTDFIEHFNNAIQYQIILAPRNLFKELSTFLRLEIPGSIFESILKILPVVAPLTVIFYLTRNRKTSIFDITIVVLVAFIVSYPNFQVYSNRITDLALLSFILWFINRYIGATEYIRNNANLAMILLLVITLPFSFSIGTNIHLLTHMSMAAVFPFSVCIGLLLMLRGKQKIHEWTYGICLLIIGITAFVPLLRPWAHETYTFRLRTSLVEQNVPTSLADAATSLNLDIKTSKAIQQYREILRQNGFKPGMPLIDFTCKPGLVFIAEGMPLAVPTLTFTGAFPGAIAAAQWALSNFFNDFDLRRSWLLTSDDQIDALDARKIVDNHFGYFPYQQIGEFTLPSFKILGPKTNPYPIDVTIKIWRPATTIPE